jgi:hypothetical protein
VGDTPLVEISHSGGELPEVRHRNVRGECDGKEVREVGHDDAEEWCVSIEADWNCGYEREQGQDATHSAKLEVMTKASNWMMLGWGSCRSERMIFISPQRALTRAAVVWAWSALSSHTDRGINVDEI